MVSQFPPQNAWHALSMSIAIPTPEKFLEAPPHLPSCTRIWKMEPNRETKCSSISNRSVAALLRPDSPQDWLTHVTTASNTFPTSTLSKPTQINCIHQYIWHNSVLKKKQHTASIYPLRLSQPCHQHHATCIFFCFTLPPISLLYYGVIFISIWATTTDININGQEPINYVTVDEFSIND